LRALACRAVLDVTDVAGVVAGVDDDGAALDPVSPDQFWLAHGGDDDIGAAHLVGQIRCARMTVGDGCVAPQKQHSHW
jgi:hypothetical protein